jgi:hypothetical protein
MLSPLSENLPALFRDAKGHGWHAMGGGPHHTGHLLDETGPFEAEPALGDGAWVDQGEISLQLEVGVAVATEAMEDRDVVLGLVGDLGCLGGPSPRAGPHLTGVEPVEGGGLAEEAQLECVGLRHCYSSTAATVGS